MGTAPAFTSAREAMEMVHAGLGWLAAADAGQLGAGEQARCLRMLEQAAAMGTAARASVLAAFTSGQGYAADADYSARAWLMHKTGVTKGAAAGHTGWARRVTTHPAVVAALAEGEMSESYGRTICQWTDKLPQDCRPAADAILVTAARSGMGLRDLAGLAAEMYQRSRPDDSDRDRDRDFADRGVRLETTFGGAGVLGGDLSPECAAVVSTVLDALSAPAGAEDTRTQPQRYHDGLQEAMRRLLAAGLLPERAGQPVKALVHVSLADLMLLEGSSALMQEWTAGVRARWAAHRAAASVAGGDGGAWLDGDAARAFTCDAPVMPVVTADVNLAALDDLVHLCARLYALCGRDDSGCGDGPGDGGSPAAGLSRDALEQAIIGRPRTCYRGREGSPRSCAAGSSAPASAGPACRWTSGSPGTSRPRSAARSSCATSTAGSPAAATSPPRPAKCTT